MLNRKLATAIQVFFQKLGKLYRKITKQLVNQYLRYILLQQRRGKVATSGFILPTTVLLLLVVALTVGALTFRAYTRNAQVIGEAQQRVIYNAATPAIDRARSKLEFLFDPNKDSRLPSGVPSQDVLQKMLLNNQADKVSVKDSAGNIVAQDAYTLPDETRIDIGGPDGKPDGVLDNAWYFRTDTNNNGKIDSEDSTVVYSIVLNTPNPDKVGNTNRSMKTRLLQMTDKDKANTLLVRQAPLSISDALECAAGSTAAVSGPGGWFEDSNTTAILRKNFQVDALVIPGTKNGTKVTLEFNQDRQLNRGNKWGAWFRNDLEIYPGPQFNWNGAMHTEGSLIVGEAGFNAYLISAPASCLYYPDSSEVTVTEITQANASQEQKTPFLGLVTSGVVKTGKRDGTSTFHLHSTDPANSKNHATLNTDTSSSNESDPINISLDPEFVLLKDDYRNRNKGNNKDKVNPSKLNLPDFGKDKKLPQRIYNSAQPTPYVDDLYRADNRWGPKPKYNNIAENQMGPTDKIGGTIPSDKAGLLRNEPVAGDEDAINLGLDGYWERRARAVGLRVLVGERLELGNLFTWYAPKQVTASTDSTNTYIESVNKDTGRGGNPDIINKPDDPSKDEYEYEGDALYPPTVKPYAARTVSHIDLHRRTLRDNLSSVQSTAVYHAAVANDSAEKDYPIACLATTTHPGTLWTLRQSIMFRPFNNFYGFDNTGNSIDDGSLLTNFFTGVGTNGWEFEPPAGSLNNFTTAISNSSSPLRKALQNLANFAGDYNASTGVGGAYPPTQDGNIHPYPALSMWGNFSNLKRALALLDGPGGYNSLSIADKTYLQTAACTLGMLAYNIDQIQKFDPSNVKNDSQAPDQRRYMAKLAADLWGLMDGILLDTNPEVLPRHQLATYRYGDPTITSAVLTSYDPRDYEKVPPEAYVAALRQYLLSREGGLKPDDPDFVQEMRLAEMIMLNYQIRRDRTYGFKPSPLFGQYAAVIEANTRRVFMSACDPDEFTFQDGPTGDKKLTLGPEMGYDPSKRPPLDKAATQITSSGVTPANSSNLATLFTGGRTEKTTLARYRLALSRLCGTIDGEGLQASVLPKFPALYYLFPETNHGLNGTGYHQQPSTEPYIADDYVRSINSTAQFQRVSDTKALGKAGFPSYQFAPTGLKCPPSSFTTSPPPTRRELERNSSCMDKDSTGADPLARYPLGHLVKPASRDSSDPFRPIDGIADITALSGEQYRVFPIEDYSVRDVAIRPRNLSDWQLPYLDTPRPFASSGDGQANFSTNLIVDGTNQGDVTTPITNSSTRAIAVPFLDRAFFNGRQLMLNRTLDIDLGMLRSKRVTNRNDTWLPVSGIVYAFREDAVREDAIARPASGDGKTNVQNPAQPVDPALIDPEQLNVPPQTSSKRMSKKAIDEYPDPDRRVHGFRLRNGVQLMRNREFEGRLFDAVKNNRGLSFFTDQPLFIQGDFNLHQTGNDDTIGTRLEEFTQLLPNNNYNTKQFYTDRKNRDERFAKQDSDRWRPTELLADSISILSNNFCDGTIADTFIQYLSNDLVTSLSSAGFSNRYPVPDFTFVNDFGSINSNRGYYHQPTKGLFDPGCTSANVTSFHNQNRPNIELKDKKTQGTRSGWDWVRENFRYDTTLPQRTSSDDYSTSYWVDFTAPIKISRAGYTLMSRPLTTIPSTPSPDYISERPLPPVLYKNNKPQFPSSNPYYGYGKSNNGRKLITAAPSRVNSIIVSGINPSRPNQGYGGLHNFPRFLESWDNIGLNFAGSFIQLSFTNYSTAPFELENLEPSNSDDLTEENIEYYRPPNRYWGYDVALQFSPAGPAAARFVSSSKNRNEFYVEPPANDPYISNLCKAVVSLGVASTNCPQ